MDEGNESPIGVGFFYFLPDLTLDEFQEGGRINREVLAARHLEPAFRDVRVIHEDCVVSYGVGPEGLQGLLVYPKPPTHQLVPTPKTSQYAAHQTWHPICGGESLWIGWETKRPPTALALSRKRQRFNYAVTDEFGNQWLILAARSNHGAGYGSLEVTFSYDADLKPVSELAESERRLWELSGQVWDDYADNFTQRTDAWRQDAAVEILGVNYRLGPAEMYALAQAGRAFLSRRRLHQVLIAFVDNELPDELEKKTSPAGSSDSDGRTADMSLDSAPA